MLEILENDLDRGMSHDRPLTEDAAGAASCAACYANEAASLIGDGYSVDQLSAALAKLNRAVFLIKAAISSANS